MILFLNNIQELYESLKGEETIDPSNPIFKNINNIRDFNKDFTLSLYAPIILGILIAFLPNIIIEESNYLNNDLLEILQKIYPNIMLTIFFILNTYFLIGSITTSYYLNNFDFDAYRNNMSLSYIFTILFIFCVNCQKTNYGFINIPNLIIIIYSLILTGVFYIEKCLTDKSFQFIYSLAFFSILVIYLFLATYLKFTQINYDIVIINISTVLILNLFLLFLYLYSYKAKILSELIYSIIKGSDNIFNLNADQLDEIRIS